MTSDPISVKKTGLVVLNFLLLCTGLSWAFHHCSPDDGGGVCPNHNTCCRTATPGLSACISVKEGEHGACCSDDGIGLTGCGDGYACKKSDSSSSASASLRQSTTTEPDETSTSSYFCERIDPHYNGTKPMPPILPRYKLMPVTPLLIKHVFGLAVREQNYAISSSDYYNDTDNTITLEDKPHHLAYFSNMQSLESEDPAILSRHARVKTAIITVHGSGRNADDYLLASISSLPPGEHNHSSKLVLAPWFLDPGDNQDWLFLYQRYQRYIQRSPNNTVPEWEEAFNETNGGSATLLESQYRFQRPVRLPPKTLTWWDGHSPPTLHHAWRYGENAINTSISSFAAMDALVERLVSNPVRFPNLERIIVTGHSAGGQFTHRWALLSNIAAWGNITVRADWNISTRQPDQHRQNTQRSVALQVVPANPRSFAFLDERRYVHSNDNFDTEDYDSYNQHHPLEVPNATVLSDCPEYNEWLFGLNRGNYVNVPYKDAAIAKAGGAQVMANRYVTQRSVQYLAGALDEQVFSDGCGSVLQGPTRRARSYHFMASLHALYGSENTHRRFLVKGVHHDHALIYQSPEAQRIFFGDDGADLDLE